jgi:hypothetical protein
MSKLSQSIFNWFRGGRGFGESARVRSNIWLAGCLSLTQLLIQTLIQQRLLIQ